MRAKDIERIANQVMGKLAAPTAASAGCSGVSDPETFECVGTVTLQQADFACQSDYECGGAGLFACDQFACLELFQCATMYTVAD